VAWSLVPDDAQRIVTQPRPVAVDSLGAEYDVDFRAWQPLSFDELVSWLNEDFLELDAASGRVAAAYLLDLAETARGNARRDEPIGTFGRLLGPAAAPMFVLARPRWSDPGSVPAMPFVGLRLYRETWDVDARAAGSTAVTRTLVYEFVR
jgi:hypothetical protein